MVKFICDLCNKEIKANEFKKTKAVGAKLVDYCENCTRLSGFQNTFIQQINDNMVELIQIMEETEPYQVKPNRLKKIKYRIAQMYNNVEYMESNLKEWEDYVGKK